MATSPPTLLEPPRGLAWERSLPPAAQLNACIPPTFRDAMVVRTAVFVQEQNIPQENEYDADDARCAHWVLYSDVSKETPIGTIRLVPYPHGPHPVPGGVYVDGELVDTTSPSTTDPSAPAAHPSSTPTTTQPTAPSSHPTTHEAKSHEEEEEPYLKLGRLAVLRTARGQGHAATLIRTALAWARDHPSYFDTPSSSPPSPAAKGQGGAPGPTAQRWNGLVLCHAQVDAVKVWERNGFRVDEAMGRWWEEGIEHVGCVLRVHVDRAGEGV